MFNKKKIEKLEAKICSLEQDLIKEKNNTETYKEILRNSNCSTLLLEENQKLIEWIKNILEEYGTFEVRERSTVHIPVYRRINASPFRYENEEFPRCEDKIIVIPEIVIYERKY